MDGDGGDHTASGGRPDEDLRAQAAQALRTLGETLSARLLDDDLLVAIRDQARSLAQAGNHAEPRDKRNDPAMAERWASLRDTGNWPVPIDGEQIIFDRSSIGGGDTNPFSIGAVVHRDGDQAVSTVIVRAPYEGPPERVHGGVVAVLMDEAMGSLMRIHSTVAYTGTLTVRYLSAAPLNHPLEFRARLVGRDGRKVSVACTGSSGIGVFAEGEATFIVVDPALLLATLPE